MSIDADWEKELFGRSVGLRQMDYAAQMQRMLQQGALVRRLVRKTQDGTLGQKTEEPEDAEDMLQLGDNTINVYNQQPPSPPQPATAATAPAGAATASAAAPAKTLLQKALPYVATGLLAAAAGGGIPWALGALAAPAVSSTSTATTIRESQSLDVGVEVIPGGATR